MAIKYSVAARNFIAGGGAMKDLFGTDGRIDFYTGSVPSDPEAAAVGTLLGTLAMSSTAFGSPTGGVVQAAAITSDTNADNNGTPTWFMVYKAAEGTGATGNNASTYTGTTGRRIIGTAGASGNDINLTGLPIVAGGTIQITSLTLAAPV